MAVPETPLEVARRHVALGEHLIAEQNALIDRLRTGGHSTATAERMLVTFEAALAAMRDHLAHEEREARK